MRILLAVSGGIDSMYMASRASELFPGACFAVAHCNFSLRGEESDGDERFVREWCYSHGMVCHVRRFDTLGYASEHGLSTEMAARELRYKWFGELLSEYGYDAVSLAHNANDDAETLILNLLRGTGLRGICGMKSRPGVLRPLLGVGREEIRTWMISRGLPWREDRTNSECLYKRNIIRNEVFPIFGRINPSFVRTLCDDMGRFSQTADIVEDFFQDARSKVMLPDGDISIGCLLGVRHWEYVLWRLLEGSGISRSDFDGLVCLLESGRQTGGKRFGPVSVGSERLKILSVTASLGRLVQDVVLRESVPSLKQPDGYLIADALKMGTPLAVRRWMNGDWMVPFGMKGRRKVSDILNEYKLTPDEKAGVEVVEMDGSHVAAILCYRIDEGVKVDDNTKQIIRLHYENEVQD